MHIYRLVTCRLKARQYTYDDGGNTNNGNRDLEILQKCTLKLGIYSAQVCQPKIKTEQIVLQDCTRFSGIDPTQQTLSHSWGKNWWNFNCSC